MSQLGGRGVPTPRRSNRLSTKASSVGEQSVVTTTTNAAASARRKGPLPKVKARKSNAYGASGRVGAAEKLSMPATGFATAFQAQRAAAVLRNEDEDEGLDELQDPEIDHVMSGALNGESIRKSPEDGLVSYAESEDPPSSDEELETSAGDTSKSYGMVHEAGMYTSTPIQQSENFVPPWQRSMRERGAQRRLQQQQTPRLPTSKEKERESQLTPEEQDDTQQSLDEMLTEEGARAANGGPTKAQVRTSAQRPRTHQPIKQPAEISPQRPNIRSSDGEERHRSTAAQRNARRSLWGEWLKVDHIVEPESAFAKYGRYAMLLLVGLALAFLLIPVGNLSEFPETSSRSPKILSAIGARVAYTYESLVDSITPSRSYRRPSGVPGKDYDPMHDRMLQTEADLLDAKENIRRILEEQLPYYVVVRRNKGGKVEIPDEFWRALSSKLQADGVGGTSTDWDAFLANNEDKLKDMFGRTLDISYSKVIPQILRQQEFLDLIEDNYFKLAQRIDRKVIEVADSVTKQVKVLASSEARKVFRDQIQLQSLVLTNLLANTELNLAKVNYFSLGLDAKIDAAHTSASFENNPSFAAKIARRISGIPDRLPPQFALNKWEEPGDCWCSARDQYRQGKTQLGVFINTPMFPDQLTIEHIPKAMVPNRNISNAPKEVELWVETDERVNHHYRPNENACDTDGPKGYVCLGKFRYDIHGSNHVQTFNLDSEVTAPIQRVVIRVNSNWGADHTCIYRVRLHGRDPEPNTLD